MRRYLVYGFVLVAVGVTAWLASPLPTPSPPPVEWARHAAGPTDELRVAWVGHSLLNHRDLHQEGARNVLEWVGSLAEASSLGYEAVDHTIFGAPLSLLWTGEPHSYARPEPEMRDRRLRVFGRERFDALVLTEGLPVGRTMETEHSAYYAQELACAVWRVNPEARVYVYETWSHLHGSDPEADYPPASVFDWKQRLRTDRAHWETLADLAATGHVPPPGWTQRAAVRLGAADHGCEPAGPIFLVPVGAVFLRLAERLETESWEIDGRGMTVGDLLSNPYSTWPEGWPLTAPLPADEEARVLASLTLRHPSEELDDVHASEVGTYVAALVHFATLYRRSPVGLPGPQVLPEETLHALQELVWQVVRDDPRCGVR